MNHRFRPMHTAGRVLRGIGHELAATIRFGAVPAAAAPRGRAESTNPAAVVAGIGSLGQPDRDSDPPRDNAEDP